MATGGELTGDPTAAPPGASRRAAERYPARGAALRRRATAEHGARSLASPASAATRSTCCWAILRWRSESAACAVVAVGDQVQLVDRAGGGLADRALRRRRGRAAVAGGAGDARHRRLSPAGHARRRRAHPRRRLRLRTSHAAAPPSGRRAGSRRHARTADPVRHRVRVPGALRADLAGRPAAARAGSGVAPG